MQHPFFGFIISQISYQHMNVSVGLWYYQLLESCTHSVQQVIFQGEICQSSFFPRLLELPVNYSYLLTGTA